MIDEIGKDKQEQEQRRRLWNEQQKARLGNNLSEKMDVDNFQTKKEEPQKDDSKEKERELPQGRSPRAIASRLRDQQAQERESNAKRATKATPGGRAMAMAKGSKQAAQRLKTFYRVINAGSAITLFGLVITWVVMNVQLIFGNLLKIKLVPKLSPPEIIIIFFIDLLILFLFLFLVSFIYILLNPSELAV